MDECHCLLCLLLQMRNELKQIDKGGGCVLILNTPHVDLEQSFGKTRVEIIT